MYIVNLFGAPGAGKTGAAGTLLGLMKLHTDIEVDYVNELVRQGHYTNHQNLITDELYLMAEKNHRLRALASGGIEVAIIDGPVLNSLVYRPESYYPNFDAMVVDVHNAWDQQHQNLNIYLPGVKKFTPVGRGEKVPDIKKMLDQYLPGNYHTLDQSKEMGAQVFDLILQTLNKKPRARMVG